MYSTIGGHLDIQHHVLYQHYPLYKNENYEKLIVLKKRFGFHLHDAGKNLGLHNGINFVINQLSLKNDQVVIGFDPDSFPLGKGWDMALVRAILGSGGKNVWSSLANPRSKQELQERGFKKVIIDGHLETWETKTPVVNSICAWSVDWLKKVGLTEPRPYYGHLETEMYSKLGDKKWTFVPGWSESDHLRDLHDREYVLFKWAHAHLKSWDGDFKDFIEAGCPIRETAPEQLP